MNTINDKSTETLVFLDLEKILLNQEGVEYHKALENLIKSLDGDNGSILGVNMNYIKQENK